MLQDPGEALVLIYELTPNKLVLLTKLRSTFACVMMHAGNLIADSLVYKFPSMEKIMTLSSDCA